MMTRRKLLQTSAAPIAGAMALPALSAAIQASSTVYRRPKLKISDILSQRFAAFNFMYLACS